MSERGVFAVDRGIFDHPVLQDSEPFCRVKAWLWLLANAAWKQHRRRVSGKVIEVGRGQLIASSRFLAREWRWSEPKVRRFLTALKTDAMIDASTDAGVTRLTICKYDEYQKVSLPTDAPKDAQSDARPTHQRRKIESKESKEVSSPNGEDIGEKPLAILKTILDDEHAEAVIAHRKRRKEPLNVIAARRLANQLAQWPKPNEAAAEMMLRNWRGFKPEWMKDRNGTGPPRRDQGAETARVFDDMMREAEERDGKRGGDFEAAGAFSRGTLAS